MAFKNMYLDESRLERALTERNCWAAYRLSIRREVASGALTMNFLETFLEGTAKLCTNDFLNSSMNYAAWVFQFLKEKEASAEMFGRFYTSDWLCALMYDVSCFDTGDTDGTKILEPSCGAGNLINYILSKLDSDLEFVGYDIDPLALKIASKSFEELLKLRKDYAAQIKIFNKSFVAENLIDKFDLCIMSPPYLSVKKLDFETRGIVQAYDSRIENLAEYFILKSADLIKPGGGLTFLCPPHLMSGESILIQYLENKMRINAVIKIYGGETSDVNLVSVNNISGSVSEPTVFELK